MTGTCGSCGIEGEPSMNAKQKSFSQAKLRVIGQSIAVHGSYASSVSMQMVHCDDHASKTAVYSFGSAGARIKADPSMADRDISMFAISRSRTIPAASDTNKGCKKW
jgi:hypothetical protein